MCLYRKVCVYIKIIWKTCCYFQVSFDWFPTVSYCGAAFEMWLLYDCFGWLSDYWIASVTLLFFFLLLWFMDSAGDTPKNILLVWLNEYILWLKIVMFTVWFRMYHIFLFNARHWKFMHTHYRWDPSVEYHHLQQKIHDIHYSIPYDHIRIVYAFF